MSGSKSPRDDLEADLVTRLVGVWRDTDDVGEWEDEDAILVIVCSGDIRPEVEGIRSGDG